MIRYTFIALLVAFGLSAEAIAAQPARYWVFFRDKGLTAGETVQALVRAETQLTGKARARRLKSMPALVDAYDLPLHTPYVKAVERTGVRIRTGSKWLNAVSVEATPEQLAQLERLPFVKATRPFRSRLSSIDVAPSRHTPALDDPDYGPSFAQNELCRIPELHQRGLSGDGVLICFLDTGFRLAHDAFDSLNVIGTWDFIFGDSIVHNQPGQDSAGQQVHGTAVLSAAAGYTDGILIGPAFGADILCAKTEWTSDETPVEEDYYAAAMEWADSLGADITSSSLGYIDWYDFEDMDGQTAVTTQAVEVAVQHGILVVTSAGNERASEWGHIVAPADADSILAVGAVDSLGVITGFSSPGPTADGRIKPDVCAQGLDVVSANAFELNGFFALSGTSLAAPLIAGVAALVMEAHTNWTAQQVRLAMMATASHAGNPNNDYGWGIVDGVAAVDYVIDDVPDAPPAAPRSAVLLNAYPNPVNGTATLTLELPSESTGRLVLYDALGRESFVWTKDQWPAGETRLTLDVTALATGPYYARFSGAVGSVTHRLMVVK